MFIRKKNIIVFLLALLMAIQPALTAAAQAGPEDGSNEKQVKIAIFSDIHYVIDQVRSREGEAAMHYSALTESRMEQEIDTILDVALEQAAEEKPDVLLACGDLLSNGEHAGGEALAEKFKAAQNMEGLQQTGIYVVNGNHDINNSYSSDFSKAEYWNAQRVQPEDFKEMFSGLGYGADDSYDKDASRRSVYTPPAGELAGSLSYVTEIAEGITLIVLDTGIYSGDVQEHYGYAQQTPGRISDGLLEWAVKEAQTAKSKGNLVLAMCHHGVIPHYSEAKQEDVDWYMSSFIIADWESRAMALADAGVTAVLTGHTHASDIAKYISPDGNVLYDIETAALCAYPTAWRTLTITINGTGQDKTYSFSVETHFIDKDFEGKEAKTADWEIMYGDNKGKTFAQYLGSMQEYGKEKSRYHQDTLRPMIDYMLRGYIYEFIKTNGSLEKYLVELLGGSETDNLKDLIAPLVPLIPAFVSFDQSFEYEPFQITLSTSEPKSADEDNKLIIYVTVTTGTEEPGQGKLVIDLDFLPQFAEDLVRKIDAELLKDDWMTNNYGHENQLLENIVDALSAAVEPLLIETKLDGSDPDTTVLNIYNDAMMAWAHGDEGKASAEDQARRKEWNKLLTGDVFIDSAKQNILAGLFNLGNLSVIADIL
ncbi:MAG: metallophosphoesterase, partial [Anaerolineaceae bacterium]|nr:metallophosphoesterase [Anaerolineaceae bacterium]